MANGKLIADQIQHSSQGTVNTQFVVNGSAKVHIRANLTTPAITGSLNVSSLVDNYTGSGKPQFTTNFAAADYTVVISVGKSGDVLFAELQADSTATTSEHRIMGRNGSEAGDADWDIGTSICMGDLA
jgi:hypothetical protein